MQLANIKDVNFIVLYGEPNAGKTTTLNELIISLIHNNAEKIKVFKGTKEDNNNFPDNEKLKLYLEQYSEKKKKYFKEFRNFIYFFFFIEKTILVITEGDDMLKLLGTLVHNFLYNKIDIVVCAAREEFLNDFVKDLLKIGVDVEHKVHKEPKEKEPDETKYDIANKDMAKKILEKIDNLIMIKKSGN